MKRLTLALVALAAPALADDDHVKPVDHALTLAECGACHMAYAPAFLPDASWNRIMDGLSDHFGEDARLDAAAVEEIRAYLVGAAPRKIRGVDNRDPIIRISQLPWFRHEHGSRTLTRAGNDPDIGTIANCAACHRGAENGWFDDD